MGQEVNKRISDEDLNEFFHGDTQNNSQNTNPVNPNYQRHSKLPGCLGILAIGVVGISLPIGLSVAGWMSVPDVAAKSTVHIDNPGKATVKSVDMRIAPITLYSADIDAEAKISLQNELDLFGAKIPTGESWMQQQVNGIDDRLTINLDNPHNTESVKISYDPHNDHLTYDISNLALSTVVDFSAGQSKTTNSGETWLNALAKPFQDSVSTIKDIADTVSGSDNSNFLWTGDLTKGQLSSQEALRAGAELYIATQVGDTCGTQIEKIPNFTEFIERNIRTAVQGKLLDINEPNNVLSAIMQDPDVAKSTDIATKLKNIANNATVNLPTSSNGQSLQVNPDQKNVEAFNKLKKTALFKDAVFTTKPFECGIGKDTPLLTEDEYLKQQQAKGTNTVSTNTSSTPTPTPTPDKSTPTPTPNKTSTPAPKATVPNSKPTPTPSPTPTGGKK